MEGKVRQTVCELRYRYVSLFSFGILCCLAVCDAIAGVFNILCLHHNHFGCCVLPADSRAVVVLHSQYICMGPVYLADRYFDLLA